MDNLDIGNLRHETQIRIDTLRQTRGVAKLDGLPFEGADELAQAEAELDALASAEGEAVRRQREIAAKAEADRIASLRAKLAEREIDRLDAVARAETAARDLCSALMEADVRGSEVAAIGRALGTTMYRIGGHDQQTRLAMHLTCALAPLFVASSRYGQIRFPSAMTGYGESWRAAEIVVAAYDFEKAMKD